MNCDTGVTIVVEPFVLWLKSYCTAFMHKTVHILSMGVGSLFSGSELVIIDLQSDVK